MKRSKVSKSDQNLVSKYVDRVQKGIYFANFKKDILDSIIQKADLLEIKENEVLLHEGDATTREMYILIKGSLVVTSKSQFIHRLDTPGDVVGEISVVDPLPRSADVIAEKETILFAFSQEVFAYDSKQDTIPNFYLLFSHVLAAKLRSTTAKSIIWKGHSESKDVQCKVMLIDENETDSLIVEGALRAAIKDIEIIRVEKAEDFISEPFSERLDLIVVDPDYKSDAEPLDKLLYLKEALKIHNAPIFFVSKYSKDREFRAEMIRMEAFEILEKPFSIFDLKHTITKFQLHLSQSAHLSQVEQDAETDQLTALPNRRKLDHFLKSMVEYHAESKCPFSLLMIDVDNFKHYNDTQGHQMGDLVLVQLAQILQNNTRKGDLAARFGGEEFVIVLPECEIENAYILAEKIRSKVEAETFPNQDSQPLGNLTISVGVACYPKTADTLKDLIKQADECLYEGKRRGRNVAVKYPF